MTAPTPDELDKWQALCDKATPGKWEIGGPYPSVSVITTMDGDEWFSVCYLWEDKEIEAPDDTKRDAAFIAAAREALPRLLARVRELEAAQRPDDSDRHYIVYVGEPPAMIDDGFGSYWLRDCPRCGAPMQVVRPGYARCSKECTQ